MSIEAMKRALEALEGINDEDRDKDFLTLKQFVRLDMAIEALRTAIQQAEAQQPATGEPVYWEWRHQGSHPDSVDFGQWSEWKRVEPRSALHTVEDALNEFRGYIARGLKYELRALYTHPAPGVPDDVVRDADRLNWLARNPVDAIDVFGKSRPDEARFIRATIDAAMLTAAQAQKGQP